MSRTMALIALMVFGGFGLPPATAAEDGVSLRNQKESIRLLMAAQEKADRADELILIASDYLKMRTQKLDSGEATQAELLPLECKYVRAADEIIELLELHDSFTEKARLLNGLKEGTFKKRAFDAAFKSQIKAYFPEARAIVEKERGKTKARAKAKTRATRRALSR
jgi:hypothetical protein